MPKKEEIDGVDSDQSSTETAPDATVTEKTAPPEEDLPVIYPGGGPAAA